MTVNGTARNDLVVNDEGSGTTATNRFVQVRDYEMDAGITSGKNGNIACTFSEQSAEKVTIEAKVRFRAKNAGGYVNFFSVNVQDANGKNVAQMYAKSGGNTLVHRQVTGSGNKDTQYRQLQHDRLDADKGHRRQDGKDLHNYARRS